MNFLKKLTVVFIALFLLTAIPLNAKEYMKYGKISDEEIAMTICPIDSNASAVVLGALGKTDFNIEEKSTTIVFTKHIRIKIFDKEAFDKGDYKIYLYKNNGVSEKINTLKGVVYNVEGGSLKKSKLSNSNTFKKEIDRNHDVVNIALPDVKEGSIIELKYSVESPFTYNLQPWYFQNDIPTIYSEYFVELIEYFNYKNWTEGYLPIQRTEKTQNQKFSFRTEGKMGVGRGGSSEPSETVEFEALVKQSEPPRGKPRGIVHLEQLKLFSANF